MTARDWSYPDRIWVERDEDTNEKHWFTIAGSGVEYVRASSLAKPASEPAGGGVREAIRAALEAERLGSVARRHDERGRFRARDRSPRRDHRDSLHRRPVFSRVVIPCRGRSLAGWGGCRGDCASDLPRQRLEPRLSKSGRRARWISGRQLARTAREFWAAIRYALALRLAQSGRGRQGSAQAALFCTSAGRVCSCEGGAVR